MLALEGIRVLDLSSGVPTVGFCTMMLGDFGAEVIKVEAPHKAGARRMAKDTMRGEEERREAAFDPLNRNKKSIALNLRSEKGRHVFYQLARKTDVIIEGFRPGVVKRLGVDYETISRLNPRVVYCSLSGYGQDGPYRNLPGHDINYISIGGALGLIGHRAGQPTIPLNLIGDLAGGALYALTGILIALIARGRTGRGQYVDTSMTEGVVSLLAGLASSYFSKHVAPQRGDGVASCDYPHYNIYQTKDGRYITLGCLEPHFWENLCRELEREDLILYHLTPEYFLQRAKGERGEGIASYLRQVSLTKTRDEWFEVLGKKDIPVGKVYTLDEVFSDRQIVHRGMVAEIDHTTLGKVKQVGIAIKLSDTPGTIRSLSPLAGEQTEEVLAELGYAREDIDTLRLEGVLERKNKGMGGEPDDREGICID